MIIKLLDDILKHLNPCSNISSWNVQTLKLTKKKKDITPPPHTKIPYIILVWEKCQILSNPCDQEIKKFTSLQHHQHITMKPSSDNNHKP